jgi:hypothetical protein
MKQPKRTNPSTTNDVAQFAKTAKNSKSSKRQEGIEKPTNKQAKVICAILQPNNEWEKDQQYIITQCILLLLFAETNKEKILYYQQFRCNDLLRKIKIAIEQRGLDSRQLFPKPPITTTPMHKMEEEKPTTSIQKRRPKSDPIKSILSSYPQHQLQKSFRQVQNIGRQIEKLHEEHKKAYETYQFVKILAKERETLISKPDIHLNTTLVMYITTTDKSQRKRIHDIWAKEDMYQQATLKLKHIGYM